MCYDSKAQPPVPPGDGGSAHGEETVLTASDGNKFAAYVATPDRPPRAQVLIFPDVRGLHQFYKDLAMRFAEQGLTALALDYFGRTAGLDARDDSFEYMPHVQQMQFDTFLADVRAALDHLRAGASEGQAADGRPTAQQSVGQATFTVGFCMGGTLSFLIGTQDLDLAGVIGFYAGMSRSFPGIGTLPERAGQIKYPALGLFGGADQGIPPEQVEAFDRALDEAGVEHEVITYPGAPHSFFDRRYADHVEACADAWTRILGFISAHTR